jgi:UTP--glucose-1-phosphate uridylyltransferase
MKIQKAIITAAHREQRHLPLQTMIDREGRARTVLAMLVDEIAASGINQLCIVISPGDEERYRKAVGDTIEGLTFIVQEEPRGYGHAVLATRKFVGDDPFLLMVSDHLFVDDDPAQGCVRQLIEAAEKHACAMSAVQATHESKLPYFGAIGGQLYQSHNDLYTINQVKEKPTPTFAEQELMVPGLRQAHYLCFFGIHVLLPEIMDQLQQRLEQLPEGKSLTLSDSLNDQASRSQYLALEVKGQRYDLESRYGLLYAQLAVALNSRHRSEVLSGLVEMLALPSTRNED